MEFCKIVCSPTSTTTTTLSSLPLFSGGVHFAAPADSPSNARRPRNRTPASLRERPIKISPFSQLPLPPESLSRSLPISGNRREPTMIPTSMAMAGPAVCRTDSMESSGSYSYSCNYSHRMMEKRQLFLRSYQFSRKRSFSERIRRSLRRVKRVVWFRLRSARRFRRLVWARLCRSVRLHVRGHGCSGLSYCNSNGGGRKRRSNFFRLLNPSSSHNNSNYDSCFW